MKSKKNKNGFIVALLNIIFIVAGVALLVFFILREREIISDFFRDMIGR